jgi:aryl-alcohol dehydrogenase-like predicted oxidoreductase
MRYKLLGKSGLRVSELCLGTMTFGEDWGWGASQEESRKVYDTFLEAGGNFIDTANIYTNGTSERLLGEFMQGQRERIVLATKYTNAAPGTDPNAAGNQRKSMVQALEASLKRLKTDYIDLYWLHIWDQITPIEEVMRAFDDLVRQGKILYAGVSDMPAWVVAKANTLADLRGWTPFVGLQIEYNLIERTPERELLPMAADLGLGVTAWSPLAGGTLTGKQLEAGGAKDSRQSDPAIKQFGFLAPDARKEAIAREVVALARQCGHSPAQVALAWLRQRATPVIPIIGARKLAQLKDNLACVDIRLEPALVQRLDTVSRIEMGFPHNLFVNEVVRSLSHGGMWDRIDGQ